MTHIHNLTVHYNIMYWCCLDYAIGRPLPPVCHVLSWSVGTLPTTEMWNLQSSCPPCVRPIHTVPVATVERHK